MKKQVLVLALLYCCLIGFAKNKRPINYRFHKNDTINILIAKENDSIKNTSRLQIVVLEAKGTKAVMKFTSFADLDGVESRMKNPKYSFIQDKERLFDKLQSIALSSITPIIRFENGKPKSMVNFKEVKDSTLVMVDKVFSLYSKHLNPDSLKASKTKVDSTMLMVKKILKPMIEEFMTEEMMLSEYSNIVQHDLPQKTGKWSETKEGATMQCSLTATQNAGEYEYYNVAKTNLNGDELKDSQLKDNPALEVYTAMGVFGKMALAFMDSLSIETTTNGVIYSNGIPKHLVKEIRTSISMMGKKKESTEKVTISVIDK